MGEALGKSLLAGLLMIGFLSADFVAGGHTELDDISDDW